MSPRTKNLATALSIVALIFAVGGVSLWAILEHPPLSVQQSRSGQTARD